MIFAKRKKVSAETLRKQRDAVLAASGYLALKKKHKRGLSPDFPNLKVESHYTLSNSVTNGHAVPSAAHHKDAKKFPLCQNHKQGYTLLTAADDIRYAGGKKT